MNKAFNFLIVAALLLGVASIVLIKFYVDARVEKAGQAAPTKEWVMEEVVVAKEPITIGSTFTQFNVEIRSVPEDFVPASAVKSLDELNGKIAMHQIPKDDIIFNAKAGTPSALPKASAVIPAGKRLVTIGVDDQSAAGYTVKNGDFVDLVGIFEITPDLMEQEEKPIGDALSVTFLQKVEVFDIIHGQTSAPAPGEEGEDADNPDAGRLAQGTTATFVVSPKEAEVILGAQRASDSVYMLLRRYDDETIIEQPSSLHARIAERLTGDLDQDTFDPGPVEVPVAPKKKIIF
ncbi:MAG: Flp pilus assembly protein CpaB [Verrucomicrobiota bacterium]